MTQTMTEAEFDRRDEEIETKYSGHDREQAMLFVESGWTQQKIADHKRIGQQFVSRQLCFGRFLREYAHGRTFEDLTERAFRGHWDATDQALSEDDRFRAVAVKLGIEPAPKQVAIIVPLRVSGNVDAVAHEIGRELGMLQLSSWGARLAELRGIVTNAAPHVIDLVRQRRVSLGAALRYVRATPQAQQTTDPAEIKRIGNEIARDRPSYAAKIKKEAKAKKPKPKSIDFLPHRDLTKLDIGDERIPGQPVQLWPAYVQRLMKHTEQIGAVALQVKQFVTRSVEKNEYSVTPEEFALGLEKTLAHRPVSGKTNGEQTDYAKKAHKDIANLEENLDRAIGWLTAIREALKAVENGRANDKMSGDIEANVR